MKRIIELGGVKFVRVFSTCMLMSRHWGELILVPKKKRKIFRSEKRAKHSRVLTVRQPRTLKKMAGFCFCHLARARRIIRIKLLYIVDISNIDGICNPKTHSYLTR